MKKFIIIYAVPILLYFMACSSKVNINSELIRAEGLMELHYDSLLSIIDNISVNSDEMTDEETALLNMLMFEAYDKNELSLPNIELINYSIAYYTKTKQNARLAKCYFYKSRISKYKREYPEAINNLLKSLELTLPTKDNSLLGKIHFDLGQIAGYQEDKDKALTYYWQAAAYFGEAGQKDNVARMYMVIGNIHLAKDMFDEAIFYANQALKHTEDSITIGDLMQDIGTTLYFSGEPDSALVYLLQCIHYPYFDTNMAMRYYNLANVYNYLDKYDTALYYVNKAFEYPIDIYIQEECYRILAHIAIEKNDTENIANYVRKREECNDSIRLLEQQPHISELEQLHQYGKTAVKMKKRISVLVASIACLLAIGGIVLYLLFRRGKQKHHKAEMYKLELEKKEELLEKKEELLEKKHELLLQNFLNELKQTRANYAAARKKADFAERENIDKKVYNEVFCFSNESAFIDKMNKILNHLPDKLKSEYPNISYKEIIWCCLFMLNIPSTDISLILDYKQSSLYKFKQRLGKKLGFNNLKDFEQMLVTKTEN